MPAERQQQTTDRLYCVQQAAKTDGETETAVWTVATDDDWKGDPTPAAFVTAPEAHAYAITAAETDPDRAYRVVIFVALLADGPPR